MSTVERSAVSLTHATAAGPADEPAVGQVGEADDAVAALAGVIEATTVVVARREADGWRLLASVDRSGLLEGPVWRAALDAVLVAGPNAPLDAFDDLRTVVVAPLPKHDTTVLAILDRDRVAIGQAERTLVRAFAEFLARRDEHTDRGSLENERTVQVLERRRRLVSEVVHDLRAPLAVIGGASHLLRTHPHEPEKVVHHARTIIAHVHRMATMIGGLLDAEARQLGHLIEDPVEVPLADLVTETVEEGRRLVSHDRLQIVGSGSGGSVRTQRVALQRLVANLVANAVKSTDAGTVSIDAHREGDAAVITVSDTGAGMSGEQMARLSGATPDANDGSGGGFGLGLSIVARLAEQLGGEVEVTSTPDEGTTVAVRVPDVAVPTA